MTLLTAGRVARAVGGELAGAAADLPLGRVVTDTRAPAPGTLFVALAGERFDGHDFVAEAREQGAAAALVERPVDDALPQIVCADTRLALGLLARAWRRGFGCPLVGVTGNSGKTTVKELLTELLAPLGPVHATRGNLNNDIGAPLTLLGLEAEHRAAVVELGANHLGEIAWTTRLAMPAVAVVTNVTGAHVGEFGGMGQIAQAKSEIFQGLPPDGVAVLNRDDPYYAFWACCAAPAAVSSFGLHPQADVQARALSWDAQGRYAFTLAVGGSAVGEVRLRLCGQHNVSNALAAAAAALALGVSASAVVDGLCRAQALEGRLSVLPGVRDTALLDDSYNANPGAVKAALDTLARFPGPRWCALGAMGELGEASDALHAEIGCHAAELGIEALYTLGGAARPASTAFADAAGGDSRHGGSRHFDNYAALEDHLRRALPNGASLLVKGSRSAGMERLVAALRMNQH
ncbi:UDP-N-acetylmuramoyl-tripeptide--D-alanyl-D-alanine ligase [Halomonas garicola]|uniref:UDP-N-acetylmuramoyl-tripeptide--D-alanyl-D- alanine ligase n=1 Tax=Halomonas garicola TaxID=1690008 RepID=UPI00289F6F1B|nr:UDP-N-acetylmuramoyl-tripeptide--D-alanyl-D-alanine ligase [Halomonas garicola]